MGVRVSVGISVGEAVGLAVGSGMMVGVSSTTCFVAFWGVQATRILRMNNCVIEVSVVFFIELFGALHALFTEVRKFLLSKIIICRELGIS